MSNHFYYCITSFLDIISFHIYNISIKQILKLFLIKCTNDFLIRSIRYLHFNGRRNHTL